MNTLHKVLAALQSAFDAAAKIAPGDLRAEIGFLVTAAVSLRLVTVANPAGFADAVTALILLIFAAGIAIERVVKAFQPAPKPAA